MNPNTQSGTEEPLTAGIDLFVTDEAGTTSPMSHYTKGAAEYAQRPEIAAKVAEETGIDDVAGVLERGLAGVKDPAFKRTAEFKQLLKVSGTAMSIGYKNGDLTLPVYDDVPGTLEELRAAGVRVRVYSSGPRDTLESGWKTTDGLDQYIEAYHSSSDKETADKFEPASYTAIARAAGVDVSRTCFMTDNVKEAEGAVKAGLAKVYFIDRKGSETLGMHSSGYEVVNDFRKVVADYVRVDRAQEQPAGAAEASE